MVKFDEKVEFDQIRHSNLRFKIQNIEIRMNSNKFVRDYFYIIAECWLIYFFPSKLSFFSIFLVLLVSADLFVYTIGFHS